MALKIAGLRKFREEVGQALDRGVDRAADYVVDLAEQFCPEDEGDLKDTIRKEGAAGSRKRQVKAGGKSGPHKFVDYAEHVEYGTYDSSAQPFIHPAKEAVDISKETKAEVAALIARCKA